MKIVIISFVLYFGSLMMVIILSGSGSSKSANASSDLSFNSPKISSDLSTNYFVEFSNLERSGLYSYMKTIGALKPLKGVGSSSSDGTSFSFCFESAGDSASGNSCFLFVSIRSTYCRFRTSWTIGLSPSSGSF